MTLFDITKIFFLFKLTFFERHFFANIVYIFNRNYIKEKLLIIILKMTVKVGINGFGRIGGLVVRIIEDRRIKGEDIVE